VARAQTRRSKLAAAEALLIAIVKARQWIDDLAHGRVASFRRHRPAGRKRPSGISACWRRSAFVSPRIVSALLEGTAPADLTPHKASPARCPVAWAEQERRGRHFGALPVLIPAQSAGDVRLAPRSSVFSSALSDRPPKPNRL